jgi:transmembrane sensor
MIRQLIADLRWRHLERQAAAWVVSIKEDRDRHEPGLRRWVGQNADRAASYNSAYRAHREAGSAARRIYASRSRHPAVPVRVLKGHTGLNLVFVIGVSLLVAATSTRFALMLLNRAQVMGVAVGARKDYTTRIGEVRTIRLADGSRVILDTGSLIRVAFTKERRGVMLDHGRARFEVAHDAGWPFVVTAGRGTVTARGTIFDVEAYKLVRVRLISGAIDVIYPPVPDRPTPAPVHLSAGQQLRFDPAMMVSPEAPRPTPRSDTEWVSGMKTFDNVPVSDIVEEVNRYSTTKIELSDPALGARRVFLDLDVRNTQEAARNLALYLQLEVDGSRPGHLVLQAGTPEIKL